MPQIFDDPGWAPERDRLAEMAGPVGYAAAQRTVLNAHYTHPDLATAMWAALAGLGFTGGRVLEPGCGSGLFLATAPESARVTGVELDPSTALIAAALHPDHEVRAESFVDTPRLPAFDAVIGNVPFSRVVLHDPRHNRAGLSMHNHFLVKALEMTRPGGVLIALTSRYTMDALNPGAREAIAARGDLLTAVRLPTGAHQQMAGTDAVTDVLVLVRHDRGAPAPDVDWLTAIPLAQAWNELGTGDPTQPGAGVSINQWWATHPDHILGRVDQDHGMHGALTLQVRPTPAPPGQPDPPPGTLARVLTAAITASTLRYTPPPAAPVRARVGPRPPI